MIRLYLCLVEIWDSKDRNLVSKVVDKFVEELEVKGNIEVGKHLLEAQLVE
jgi:hypothetical protein